MSRNRLSLMLSFLAVAFAGPAASAGLVTWEFGGVITSVDDSLGVAIGLVDVGSAFSGSFTFDSTTPDQFPLNPEFGTYKDAIVDISGSIGLIEFLAAEGFVGVVRVSNDVSPSGEDGLGVSVSRVLTDLLGEPSDFFMVFADSTGTVFSNDLLPTVLPDFALFDGTSFTLVTASETFSLNGTVTSLVPEPTTLIC